MLAAGGYLTALGLVVLWPTTISEPFTRQLGRLDDRFPGSVEALEFIANIVLFIPAGLLLAVLLGPGRRWLAMLAGVALSTAIEFAQGILLPARVATLSDIVANSTGALVGVLIAAGYGGRRRSPGGGRSGSSLVNRPGPARRAQGRGAG